MEKSFGFRALLFLAFVCATLGYPCRPSGVTDCLTDGYETALRVSAGQEKNLTDCHYVRCKTIEVNGTLNLFNVTFSRPRPTSDSGPGVLNVGFGGRVFAIGGGIRDAAAFRSAGIMAVGATIELYDFTFHNVVRCEECKLLI